MIGGSTEMNKNELSMGDRVIIRLRKSINGEKEIAAELSGAGTEGITVTLDSGEKKTYRHEDIISLKPYMEF